MAVISSMGSPWRVVEVLEDLAGALGVLPHQPQVVAVGFAAVAGRVPGEQQPVPDPGTLLCWWAPPGEIGAGGGSTVAPSPSYTAPSAM